MKKSLAILLEGLVDYAGLFPPAALSMQDAVRNYARYQEGPFSRALGRFVVPLERVAEVPDGFPLSILGIDERTFGEATHEVKATSSEEVERIAAIARGRTVYVEIVDLILLDAIARLGLRAKIRTGGVTVEAFPTPERIAQFLCAAREKGVAFKATAGLHHPLRCVRPLTYEPDAPTGTMHGFLNVFLAAAMPEHAEEVLETSGPGSFVFDDEGVMWRGIRVTNDALVALRRDAAISFGSCSFEEPIDDLRALGWID